MKRGASEFFYQLTHAFKFIKMSPLSLMGIAGCLITHQPGHENAETVSVW